MQNAVAYQSYQQTGIETASPEKLLLMLYSAAIARLERARQDMQSARFAEVHEALVKVQDIVLELMVSLDWDQNRELCSNLHGLYDYVYRRLVHANVHKDVVAVNESLSILNELHAGWEQVIGTTKEPPAREVRSNRLNISG